MNSVESNHKDGSVSHKKCSYPRINQQETNLYSAGLTVWLVTYIKLI